MSPSRPLRPGTNLGNRATTILRSPYPGPGVGEPFHGAKVASRLGELERGPGSGPRQEPGKDRVGREQFALVFFVTEQAEVGFLLGLLRPERLLSAALQKLAIRDALGAGEDALLTLIG